jgi:hypothetical protein
MAEAYSDARPAQLTFKLNSPNENPAGGLREPVTGFLDPSVHSVMRKGREDKPGDVCGFRVEPILFFGRTASTRLYIREPRRLEG